MVVSLGPGKFYGTSLPRPRIYTDVKFNGERVDPPVSVVDPLISWAQEAHWSMGGLSFKRLRHQGRIEGNVKKLRSEREKTNKKRNSAAAGLIDESDDELVLREVDSPSPPPAPIATKRKRFTADLQTEIPKKGGSRGKKNRTPARKLDDEFDRVAAEGRLLKSPSDAPATMASRTRSGRTPESEKVAVAMKASEYVNTQKSKKKKLRRIGEIQKAKEAAAERGSMTPTGKNASPTSIKATRSSPRQAKTGSH